MIMIFLVRNQLRYRGQNFERSLEEIRRQIEIQVSLF